MRIAFLVNDVDTEHPSAATTVMAFAAARMGHDVTMVGVADLSYYSDGRIEAVGRKPPVVEGVSQAEFLQALQSKEAERTTITSGDLDVLYLRYNPVEEGAGEKPWVQEAGLIFGQMAVRRGVIVLSHPYTMPFAISKMYLEHFPAEVRPQTLITRDVGRIRQFHESQGGRIVLKPLQGYGGKDVFLLDESAANLQQIVESITRYSYVVAQEFLPAATEGDTRLFLFNARPLQRDGKYAAIRRVNSSGDFRSNMSLGARPEKAEITPRMLEIAELVRPRLLADGIFDVGLDIVGDKLVEINAISAGGLNAASHIEQVDFGVGVIELIERKVEFRKRYGAQLRNRALAVMD